MKKCLYYDENSERRCTHPSTNRTCCAPEGQPKQLSEEDIKQFCEENPEFDISDFADVVILNPEAGDAIRQFVDGRDMLRAQASTTFTCYQCLKDVKYLFEDARCKDCTRLTPEEVRGEVSYDPDEE